MGNTGFVMTVQCPYMPYPLASALPANLHLQLPYARNKSPDCEAWVTKAYFVTSAIKWFLILDKYYDLAKGLYLDYDLSNRITIPAYFL